MYTFSQWFYENILIRKFKFKFSRNSMIRSNFLDSLKFWWSSVKITPKNGRKFEKWCEGLQISRDSVRELCKSQKILKMSLFSLSEASTQPRKSLRKSMKVLKICLIKPRQQIEKKKVLTFCAPSIRGKAWLTMFALWAVEILCGFL